MFKKTFFIIFCFLIFIFLSSFLINSFRINKAALLFANGFSDRSIEELNKTSWKNNSSSLFLNYLLTNDLESLIDASHIRPNQYAYINLLIDNNCAKDLPPTILSSESTTLALFLTNQALKQSYKNTAESKKKSLLYIWTAKTMFDYPEINYTLGEIWRRSFKASFHSKRLFLLSLKQSPKNSNYWNHLGYVYGSDKDFIGRLSCNIINYRLDPDSIQYQINIANNLQQLKNSEEAISILINLLRNNPENINIYFTLGSIHRQNKEFDTAEYYYKEATELFTDEPRAFYELGNYFYTTKEYRKALLQHTKAIGMVLASDKSISPWWWYRKGLDFFQIKDFEGAVKSFQNAYLLNDNPTFSYWLGRSYHANKQFKLAIENYTSYIQKYPKNTSAIWYRANCYTESNEINKAIDDIETLLKIKPSNKTYMKKKKELLEHKS
ncbi:MAG: tetratricopeptide repeat protein [Caldisericia bacterium]|nr:tetratricopeptide repeat protein [Caldisericia bacterium]